MENIATSPAPEKAHGASAVPSAEALARGYETTHVSIRPLLLVVGCLAMLVAGIYFAVWYLQSELLRQASASDRATSMIQIAARDNDAPLLQPSGPIHDTTAAQDMVKLRAEEDAVFARLGWRNSETGEMSAPDNVVQAIASRSLPTTLPSDGGIR
jgi:hypothetical protein